MEGSSIVEISKPQGTVIFTVRDRQGNVIRHERMQNLIVNGGRNAMARLLSGDATKEIAELGVGTSGTAATLTDTALTGLFSNAITGVSYPATGQAKFDWLLDYADANGMAIRELGLLTADGTLFCRKVTDVINKTADIQLQGSWIIQF